MRTIIYSRWVPTQNRIEAELLRAAVESRGNTVIATFNDDPSITGRGEYAGWRALITSLDQADQVIVGSVGDLPGKIVPHLLKILGMLREHDVSLAVHHEAINTDDGHAAILDLIAAYRATKLSEAIRRGIFHARKAGKIIGMPRISNRIREQIRVALQNGASIRRTARRFKISGGTVSGIRQMMNAEVDRLAA